MKNKTISILRAPVLQACCRRGAGIQRTAMLLLATLLLTMTAQTAWADTWPEYITDVILVGGTESEVNAAKSAHSDYTFISQDLNAGCGSGSDYIYLGYKTGYRANVNGGYITDIIVVTEGSNAIPTGNITFSGRTYNKAAIYGGDYFVNDVKGDLNSKAGGWGLWLYYTKANFSDKRAISSISFSSTQSGSVNCYKYWNGELAQEGVNMNRGCDGGDNFYMHLSTATKTNRPSADPVMASGLTYNDGEQQLIATAATLASGTMYYRIGTSGSFTSTVADVKATAAGSYTVYYYAGSNSYSDASSTHSTTVTIGKSANSGVTVSCADIVEGNALNPQLGGTNLSTGAVTYKYCTSQNGTYSTTAPTTAGTYWVKATIAADDNCYEYTTPAVSFKMLPDWALHNTGDSEADAYVITTTGDLDLLAQRVNAGNDYKGKYFRLGGNITYSHDSEWNNTTSTENNYTPIGKSGATFKGHFDGKGFTVSGIRISSSSDYNGLFGYLYDGATVKNVILSDARIMSGSYSGGIAGDCNISTITNCWVKSNVCIGRYSYVGGIAGNLYGGAIIGCRSEATLIAASGSGRQRYGGIAGSLNVSAANVKHCIVAGATVPGTAYRGAVVGRLWLGSLTNNYYINCSVAGVADATNVGCTDDTNLADTNGARHAVTIGAATGVTITPVGTATTYDVSGITAYEGNNVIGFGGKFYAGATEQVRLTADYAAPADYTLSGYTDGQGNALTDNGDGTYTLTMTAEATTVTPDGVSLWGTASGADGSQQHPYVITTTAGLDLLAQKVNSGTNYSGQYFELGADIAYDKTVENNFTPIGNKSKTFKGHFDGKGHTVSGINVNLPSTDYVGLFAYVSYATIQNLTLANSTICGGNYVGDIVGSGGSTNTTIENCHVESDVTVSGTYYVGGIVGIYATVRGCTGAATVSATASDSYAGGIISFSDNSTIEDCLVYGGAINGTYAGAIAGTSTSGGTLTNNYHTIHGMGGVNGSDQDGAEIVVRIAAADGVTLSLPAATYVWNEQNLYKSGTVVTLNCTVPDGKVFDHYTVNSGDISNADSQTGEHTLTGFSQDVTITGIFADLVNVTYIAADGTAQSHAAAEIDGSKTNLPGGWYVVNSNVNLTTKLNFTGDTHLILADGKTLSIDASGDSGESGCYFGLSCKEGEIVNGATYHDLTIYGQAAGTGKISSYCGQGYSAWSYDYFAENITINGGVVEATGSQRGVHARQNLTINSGQVKSSNAKISGNHVTLGWRNSTDYIQAYEIKCSDGGSIQIANGKVFTDGTNIHNDATTSGVLDALQNVTLRPCLVLADNASNADAIAEYDGETIAVALNGRTLYKDGSWNTLCLPFSVTTASGTLSGDNVQAMTLNTTTSNFADGTLTLNFTAAATIPAGTPFIIKWDNTGVNIENPVFENATIDAEKHDATVTGVLTFTGTYAPVTIDDGGDNTMLYLGSANTLYYPTKAMTIGCHRAYFQLADGITAGEPVSGSNANQIRAFNLNFGDNEATGIVSAEANSSLLHSSLSEWYTIDGRKLDGQPTAKGLYIHGGKKVVIK